MYIRGNYRIYGFRVQMYHMQWYRVLYHNCDITVVISQDISQSILWYHTQNCDITGTWPKVPDDELEFPRARLLSCPQVAPPLARRCHRAKQHRGYVGRESLLYYAFRLISCHPRLGPPAARACGGGPWLQVWETVTQLSQHLEPCATWHHIWYHIILISYLIS